MGKLRQTPPTSELKLFSGRLKKAIAAAKKNTAVLAKDAEYKPCDINNLLKGIKEPGMRKLILLAKSLDCTVDYLLGLTKAPQYIAPLEANLTPNKEPAQTSSTMPIKYAEFQKMLPKLLESDIELLMYIAEYLVERKKNGLKKLAKAINTKSLKKVNNTFEKTAVTSDEFKDNVLEDDDDWEDFDDDDDDTLDDDWEFDVDDFEDDEFEDE